MRKAAVLPENAVAKTREVQHFNIQLRLCAELFERETLRNDGFLFGHQNKGRSFGIYRLKNIFGFARARGAVNESYHFFSAISRFLSITSRPRHENALFANSSSV